MAKVSHVTVRIDGPIFPQSGNAYRVNYNNGQTSNPASLSICIGVARAFNKRQRGNCAFVEYVGNETK